MGAVRLGSTVKVPQEYAKFIEWNPNPLGARVQVSLAPGYSTKRAGEVGEVIGSLSVKRCGAYCILVKFADGKVEAFNPGTCYPASEAA